MTLYDRYFIVVVSQHLVLLSPPVVIKCLHERLAPAAEPRTVRNGIGSGNGRRKWGNQGGQSQYCPSEQDIGQEQANNNFHCAKDSQIIFTMWYLCAKRGWQAKNFKGASDGYGEE